MFSSFPSTSFMHCIFYLCVSNLTIALCPLLSLCPFCMEFIEPTRTYFSYPTTVYTLWFKRQSRKKHRLCSRIYFNQRRRFKTHELALLLWFGKKIKTQSVRIRSGIGTKQCIKFVSNKHTCLSCMSRSGIYTPKYRTAINVPNF